MVKPILFGHDGTIYSFILEGAGLRIPLDVAGWSIAEGPAARRTDRSLLSTEASKQVRALYRSNDPVSAAGPNGTTRVERRGGEL
jgi:hypothetical protein